MLDWKSAMREERAALQRIVTLLLALADLAERAQHRSPLVRRFVVWIMRQAEMVARDFVIGPAETTSCSMQVGPAGAAEAMRLAEDFRDLAHELDRQATLAFAVPHRIHDFAGQAGPARVGTLRTLDAADFQNILRRLALVKTASRAACATGPPDTS